MKKIYLTFDMDWVSDDIFRWFYEEISKLGIRGTLHVTNDSVVLNEIRRDEKLELGIHPNFNNLLCGESGSVEQVINELKGIVPEAVSSRSHSLMTSSRINICLFQNGIKFESNIFYEPMTGMKLSSFADYSGLVHVPFFFEDDLYLMNKNKIPIKQYLENYEVPLVFNFHPIHLLLNTESIQRYEQAKKYTKDYIQLKKFVNKKEYGIRDLFIELVNLSHDEGVCFRQIKEIETIL